MTKRKRGTHDPHIWDKLPPRAQSILTQIARKEFREAEILEAGKQSEAFLSAPARKGRGGRNKYIVDVKEHWLLWFYACFADLPPYSNDPKLIECVCAKFLKTQTYWPTDVPKKDSFFSTKPGTERKLRRLLAAIEDGTLRVEVRSRTSFYIFQEKKKFPNDPDVGDMGF
jgi:hypothetical protein